MILSRRKFLSFLGVAPAAVAAAPVLAKLPAADGPVVPGWVTFLPESRFGNWDAERMKAKRSFYDEVIAQEVKGIDWRDAVAELDRGWYW